MALRYALLGLLNYSEMSGYDINKLFEDSIDHFWHASMSQIYRELNALEESGLLTSELKRQQDKPDKRVYSITPQGRAEFESWLKVFPENPAKRTRDEFSLRLFFGSGMKKSEVLNELERFKEQKLRSLGEVEEFGRMVSKYAEKFSLFNSEEIYWRFILKKARHTLTALIAWADECIAELEEEKE